MGKIIDFYEEIEDCIARNGQDFGMVQKIFSVQDMSIALKELAKSDRQLQKIRRFIYHRPECTVRGQIFDSGCTCGLMEALND